MAAFWRSIWVWAAMLCLALEGPATCQNASPDGQSSSMAPPPTTSAAPARKPISFDQFIYQAVSQERSLIALMRNFVPLSLEEVVTEEGLKSAGLYQLLRQNGIHLRLASQTIGARSAQRREARLLKVPAGGPLLTMRRISYDDAGQPVEYGSHVYPAERYSFEMSVVADSRT